MPCGAAGAHKATACLSPDIQSLRQATGERQQTHADLLDRRDVVPWQHETVIGICAVLGAMLTEAVHGTTQGLRAMQKRMDAALAAAGAARALNGAARPSRGSRTSVSGPAGRRTSVAPGPSTSAAAAPLAGDRELFASLVPLIQAPPFIHLEKPFHVPLAYAMGLKRSSPCVESQAKTSRPKLARCRTCRFV